MSDDNSPLKAGIQIVVVAAVGTLAAKLVQTGFDALFRKKEPEEPRSSRRAVERLSSITLMLNITKAHMDSVALQYEPLPLLPLDVHTTFIQMSLSLQALQESLQQVDGLFQSEYEDYRSRLELIRSNIDRHERTVELNPSCQKRSLGEVSLKGPEKTLESSDNQQQPEVTEDVE